VRADVDRERIVLRLEPERVPSRATADVEHRATQEAVALAHQSARIERVTEVVLPDVPDLPAVAVDVPEVAAFVLPALVIEHRTPEWIRPVHTPGLVRRE
jgi:hypothetical protein